NSQNTNKMNELEKTIGLAINQLQSSPSSKSNDSPASQASDKPATPLTSSHKIRASSQLSEAEASRAREFLLAAISNVQTYIEKRSDCPEFVAGLKKLSITLNGLN